MSNTEDQKPADPVNPAADLIRQKVDRSYRTEPNAKQEMAEVRHGSHSSLHQKFMYDLSTSGKSLAEIQTAWHNYYQALPDDQKHQVWHEFYAQYNKTKASSDHTDELTNSEVVSFERKNIANRLVEKTLPRRDPRTTAEVKAELLKRITKPHKASKKQHLHSLIFGLGMGSLMVFVTLFGFFNERFIAPFITPSRTVSSTALIIDPSTTAVGPEPKIIIPKINVELPVDFDETSVDEKTIQKDLEKGVVHYPTTSLPGENGNGAIFGHSSNNIFNKGKYKFAFVLLKHLEKDDTFYIQHKSKRYAYKVYDKQVVKPTELSVLEDNAKTASFTLITCDPPGSSLNRLVIWGEQISPDVNNNIANTAKYSASQTKILPSNAPSLWQRIVNWF